MVSSFRLKSELLDHGSRHECLPDADICSRHRTGGFQHSSFLFGARVTSAGLLKVRFDPRVTSRSLQFAPPHHECDREVPRWVLDLDFFSHVFSDSFSSLQASDGKLTSLSPLSGHYRAGTMHFKAFVRGLEDQGVDMGS